ADGQLDEENAAHEDEGIQDRARGEIAPGQREVVPDRRGREQARRVLRDVAERHQGARQQVQHRKGNDEAEQDDRRVAADAGAGGSHRDNLLVTRRLRPMMETMMTIWSTESTLA